MTIRAEIKFSFAEPWVFYTCTDSSLVLHVWASIIYYNMNRHDTLCMDLNEFLFQISLGVPLDLAVSEPADQAVQRARRVVLLGSLIPVCRPICLQNNKNVP